MRRRTFLAGTVLGLTGCLGSPSGTRPSDGSGDDDPSDGYPPRFEETPAAQSVDPSSFTTVTQEGIEVPLVPIDIAYYWYRRRAARFVDARGQTQYDQAHIAGAVLSPAPSGSDADPVRNWPKADRIVGYCGCPHHLSSIRAANLLANGFENVYVIDEGFWEWHERGYPMAGSEITTQPVAYVIQGWTDPAFAGETVWAWHGPTDQREAAAIGNDGGYELELRFVDVAPASVIQVQTPQYTVQAPLRELVVGEIVGSESRTDG